MQSGPTVSAPTRFQQWLRIETETKPRVYGQVFESAGLSSLNYWLEIVFSAAIATFGLVLNSPDPADLHAGDTGRRDQER
jgi:hypothetical protein